MRKLSKKNNISDTHLYSSYAKVVVIHGLLFDCLITGVKTDLIW